MSPASELSEKGFKAVVDIDLNGTFHVAKAAFPFLAKPGGCILNISAPQATVAYPYQAHVSAAKAGVEMLTRSLAFEWGALGIRVNAIVPGPVAETEGMRRLTPTKSSEDATSQAVPLRRYARAGEIASLAAYLATDAQHFTFTTYTINYTNYIHQFFFLCWAESFFAASYPSLNMS